MARPDLTVRGAGIFGLSIAWAAARRGARVRVIEAHAIGAGASGRGGGRAGTACAGTVEPEEGVPAGKPADGGRVVGAKWMRLSGYRVRLRSHGSACNRCRMQAAVEQARARAEGAARLWQGKAVWDVVATDPADGHRTVPRA